MKVIALIPARGGSKGIPRKNLRMLCGRPLIEWTIEASLKSGIVSRTIVSTDDPEIAAAAVRAGAEVPFMRPAEFATDGASSIDVALHALDWLASTSSETPERLLLLQPTSPLRRAEDIRGAFDLALARGAEAVVGVTPAEPSPFLAFRMEEGGELAPVFPVPVADIRRQDLPPAFYINGAIYLNTVASLRARKSFLPPSAIGYVMPNDRSIDIDTPVDLQIAGQLMLNERD